MALIVHLVAVKSEYLAPPRFLALEEHANTLQEQRGRLNSSLEMETKRAFDIKGDQPLGFAGGRRRGGLLESPPFICSDGEARERWTTAIEVLMRGRGGSVRASDRGCGYENTSQDG